MAIKGGIIGCGNTSSTYLESSRPALLNTKNILL